MRQRQVTISRQTVDHLFTNPPSPIGLFDFTLSPVFVRQ
jgi:hypothetical protein